MLEHLGAARLARSFERDGLRTAALHGDKSQDERLKHFKEKRLFSILMALSLSRSIFKTTSTFY